MDARKVAGRTFALLSVPALIASLSGCAGRNEPTRDDASASSGSATSASASTSASAAPSVQTASSDAAPSEPAAQPPRLTQAPEPGATVRVGGDMAVVATPVERRDGLHFRSGVHVVNEYLPVGYPAPTPPGAIDIKTYPAVRRAEYRVENETRRAANRGFFPLFYHIQRRGIAMTSPVEMDYEGLSAEDPQSEPTSSTMSFLYRRMDQGPLGPDRGNVTVRDAEPVTVISVGMTGSPSDRIVRDGLAKLREYLATQSEWRVAGDPRGLFYNGPDIRESRKWAEIQLPIERIP